MKKRKPDVYEVLVRRWPDDQTSPPEDHGIRTRSLTRVLDLMQEHIGAQSCIIWVKKNGRTVWKVKPLG